MGEREIRQLVADGVLLDEADVRDALEHARAIIAAVEADLT